MTTPSPLPARLAQADGTAALGICESLLIALTELKIMKEDDARDLLNDVATAHEAAAVHSDAPEAHHAVVAIMRRILSAKDGVRHVMA